MGRSRTGDRHGADRAFPADRGWAFKCPVATASSEYFNANVDVEPLKTVIIFSGIGLLLPLLAIQTYGLDLSVGFFFKAQPRAGTTPFSQCQSGEKGLLFKSGGGLGPERCPMSRRGEEMITLISGFAVLAAFGIAVLLWWG